MTANDELLDAVARSFEGMVERGIAEQGEDGRYRLTPLGVAEQRVEVLTVHITTLHSLIARSHDIVESAMSVLDPSNDSNPWVTPRDVASKLPEWEAEPGDDMPPPPPMPKPDAEPAKRPFEPGGYL